MALGDIFDKVDEVLQNVSRSIEGVLNSGNSIVDTMNKELQTIESDLNKAVGVEETVPVYNGDSSVDVNYNNVVNPGVTFSNSENNSPLNVGEVIPEDIPVENKGNIKVNIKKNI